MNRIRVEIEESLLNLLTEYFMLRNIPENAVYSDVSENWDSISINIKVIPPSLTGENYTKHLGVYTQFREKKCMVILDMVWGKLFVARILINTNQGKMLLLVTNYIDILFIKF